MTEHDTGRINIERDHNCFGCGRLNEYGLQLAFYPHDRGEYGPALFQRRGLKDTPA